MAARRVVPSVARAAVDLSGPVRTCVGCRRRAPAAALFRVVRAPEASPAAPGAPSRLEVDTRRRLPGRGAWVHPDPGCVDLAIRRRAFVRALRVTGTVDPEAVLAHVRTIGPAG